MIVTLTGEVSQKGPLWAVIDVQGLGYCVHMPVGTLEALPALGTTTSLHTHVVYREEAQTLFGFGSIGERDFFRILVEKVSGVGPKLALALLSTFSLKDLEQALDTQDIAGLSRCPGIGKKTAERLILELRDKRPPTLVSSAPILGAFHTQKEGGLPPAADQALSGLLSLGYAQKEAQKALERVLKEAPEDASTEWLLKQALRG